MHFGVKTGESYGDDVASGTVMVLVNLAIIPLAYRMVKADNKVRAKDDEEKRKLYGKLMTAEVEDRKKYDIAWQGYVNEVGARS